MTTLDPSLTDDDSFERTRIEADSDGTWPPEPTVITHILGGALADRVRRRLGADDREEVRLIETTTHGGYSFYTQEHSTEFTIKTDTRSETFYPNSSTADWRDDAGKSWADSVFARFDAWLAIAERPAALFAEWFEHDEESGPVVRFRARPDTTLARTAKERHNWVHHLSLTGISDGHGRRWRLDFVAAPDSTGFQQIIERHPEFYADGLTISDDVARAILEAIGDRILPGTSNW